MFSNITAKEEFRLTGTVSGDRLDELLDRSEALDKLEGLDAHIEEAKCQYPAEDFLSGITDRLHELAKRLRGDNRQEVLGIIEALDDIGQTTFYASDYGRSELGKALEIVKAAL